MAYSTKNVKLGVCKVFFDGVDLGLTQGGVEVSVKTDTHKVNVDQYGKTPINEYIMGREVSVKAPLAETTLENLVATMPGSTLTTDGIKASITSGTITGNWVANDTLTVGGVTFTFKATAVNALDVAVGASLSVAITNLVAAINAYPGVDVSASGTATTFTLTADKAGIDGNTIAVSKTGTGATYTIGATLTGGTDATKASVTTNTGVGTNLLSIAKRLVLRPVDKAATNDPSEDFVIFKAATAGQLSFAYKLENERIYNCEFMGYPDNSTGSERLFAIGNIGTA